MSKVDMKVDGLDYPGIRTIKVDYPSNSNKDKEERMRRKPPEKVASVIHKKKTFFDVVNASLTSGDDNFLSYLIEGIVFPAIKDLISDIISGSFDAIKTNVDDLLYDGKERPYQNSRSNGGQYVYYNKVSYGKPQESQRNTYSNFREKTKTPSSPNDIVFPTLDDAKSVLSNMLKYISTYEFVSLSEFYDFIGETCDFQCNKWGWRDLRSAYIRKIRGNRGYQIVFPNPEPIEGDE